MGIENIDGTIAHPVPGRNSVSWTISNDYVAFIPLTCDSIVDVTVLTRPQVVGTANPDPACVGDNVTFTGSGADTYSWTNGVTDGVPFNVTASDDYIVTGTSVEGCVNWDTVSLIVNPNPTISLSPNDEMNGNDGSINLTILNGAAPFTFDWDNDGTGDNDDSNDLFNVGAGTYTVTMTDGNGCSVTDQATIGTQVGIVELDSDQFTIYPNPTEGIFSVSISEEIHASKAFLMVTDGLGRRIIDQQIDDQKTDVDISKEQNGIYYVKIINDNGVYVQKINLNK